MADEVEIIIRVHEGDGHRTEHNVGVNGSNVKVPVGKDVPVSAETLEAIRNSNIPHTIVSGDTESPQPEADAGAASGAEGSSSEAAAQETPPDATHDPSAPEQTPAPDSNVDAGLSDAPVAEGEQGDSAAQAAAVIEPEGESAAQ